MKSWVLIIMAGMIALGGCAAPQTNKGKGAAYGAAGGAVAGAVLGQAIGRDTEGTLIGAAAGAAVGAAAGAGVGHMMDKQEAEMRDALAASEAAAVRREGELLAITLKGDFTFDLDSDVIRPGLYNEQTASARRAITSGFPSDEPPTLKTFSCSGVFSSIGLIFSVMVKAVRWLRMTHLKVVN